MTRMTLTSGGNFLVGTTTDSSNGKVQLAESTANTGGIGFGTDTSLYRTAAGALRLSAGSGNASLEMAITGTRIGSLTTNGAVLWYDSATDHIFRTGASFGGTTAMTLDSSQNATFAGTVIANKATTAFRIPTAETPASASATGTIGTITWDASYIYVCTAANTWKRVAIATW